MLFGLSELPIHFINEVAAATDTKPSVLQVLAGYIGVKRTPAGYEFTQKQIEFLLEIKNKFRK